MGRSSGRDVEIQRLGKRFHFSREDFNPCHAELRSLARHRRDQQIAVLCQQHVLSIDFMADGSGTVHREGNVAGVLHLGHVV
jgi:hypothetical protein